MSLSPANNRSNFTFSSFSFQTPSPAKASLTLGDRTSATKSSNPQSAKKKQSQLKSLVHQFLELVQTWLTDVNQIQQIIEALASLFGNVAAINRVFLLNQSWNLLLTPSHPQLHHRLLAQLLADVENMASQLRMFQRRLSDDVIAVNMKYDESVRSISGEVLGELDEDSGAIFTSEHINVIENIARQINAETKRKTELLEGLYIMMDKVSIFSATELSLPSDLQDVLAVWGNDSSFSLIAMNEVNDFLARNNF